MNRSVYGSSRCTSTWRGPVAEPVADLGRQTEPGQPHDVVGNPPEVVRGEPVEHPAGVVEPARLDVHRGDRGGQRGHAFDRFGRARHDSLELGQPALEEPQEADLPDEDDEGVGLTGRLAELERLRAPPASASSKRPAMNDRIAMAAMTDQRRLGWDSPVASFARRSSRRSASSTSRRASAAK